jgi:GAF domain-containing protein
VNAPQRSSERIAAALADAATALNTTRTLAEILDSIARSAVSTVPGIDHVGISIRHHDGTIETMAATDDLVPLLDALQYEVDEGPCVDSLTKSEVVVVEHAATDRRWPHYLPRAVEAGLRSQLGLRIYTDGETLGGLNLYSTASDTVDPEAANIAQLFAAHAAVAMGRARREEQLNNALVTRKAIGQAIGILMERYRITEDRAFHFLLRASQTSNTKLRIVAQQVVSEAEGRFALPHDGKPER